MTEAIIDELKRIYLFDQSRWDQSWFADFSAEEAEAWAMAPDALEALAVFIGRESTLPHEKVRMLYGPYEIAEWNSTQGTFGQLRTIDPDYPYDKVLKFGEDAFLDVAGQLGEAGGVYECIGHDLGSAKLIAPSLLALLKQAGSYRD